MAKLLIVACLSFIIIPAFAKRETSASEQHNNNSSVDTCIALVDDTTRPYAMVVLFHEMGNGESVAEQWQMVEALTAEWHRHVRLCRIQCDNGANVKDVCRNFSIGGHASTNVIYSTPIYAFFAPNATTFNSSTSWIANRTPLAIRRHIIELMVQHEIPPSIAGAIPSGGDDLVQAQFVVLADSKLTAAEDVILTIGSAAARVRVFRTVVKLPHAFPSGQVLKIGKDVNDVHLFEGANDLTATMKFFKNLSHVDSSVKLLYNESAREAAYSNAFSVDTYQPAMLVNNTAALQRDDLWWKMSANAAPPPPPFMRSTLMALATYLTLLLVTTIRIQ